MKLRSEEELIMMLKEIEILPLQSRKPNPVQTGFSTVILSAETIRRNGRRIAAFGSTFSCRLPPKMVQTFVLDLVGLLTSMLRLYHLNRTC